MAIYIEKLNLLKFFGIVVPKIMKARLKRKNLNKIYYFNELDSTIRNEYKLISLICNFINTKVIKCNIEIRNIRFDNGECINARIARKDIFELQNNIIESDAYKLIYNSIWENDRILNYIQKSLIRPPSEVEKKNTEHLDFNIRLIQKVYWHMREQSVNDGIFVINKRPWMEVYVKYAASMGIELLAANNYSLDSFSIITMTKRLIKKTKRLIKKFPIIINFIRKVRSYSFNIKKVDIDYDKINSTIHEVDVGFDKSNSKRKKISFFGVGEFNLMKDGYNSDFYFYLYSDLPSRNIASFYNSKNEKVQLNREGIHQICINNNKIPDNKIDGPKYCKYYGSEYDQLFSIIRQYNKTINHWHELFIQNSISIFLTWYKYYSDHYAIADAINETGGVLAIWERSFEGEPSPEFSMSCDIYFRSSMPDEYLNQKNMTNVNYQVQVGFLRDYGLQSLRLRAVILRNSMINNGVTKIVSVFDQNSFDEYTHEIQRENYKFILMKVLETPWLGVIFKPKKAKTLKSRLGKDVVDLLQRAVKTGRCHIYDSYGKHQSNVPVVLAALSSDVCIHSHLYAGSAAVESAIMGIPTLLLDREGHPNSKLYRLEKGKVIFNNWPELIDNLIEYFKSPANIPGFGDWSAILDELDPFRDGKGPYRMGTYLHWLIQGFEQGLDREVVLADVAERYCKKWGYDKITVN